MWVYWLAMAALAIGAGMGLYALINPRWAAWLVRLRDDPARPGGAAEFRGTYGGLFFATHSVALFLLIASLYGPPAAAGSFTGLYFPAAIGALLVCASAWIGTAIGRALSIALDGTGGGFNAASIGFELTLGFLLLAPLIAAPG